jgi:HEAT repeat protein
LASYLEAYTDRVLFILDGYDEITDRIEQPGYNHLNRILADITSQQHILLTSRPIMIDTLGDHPIQFDRRLENMGFLNENIEAYVHQFMCTSQKPEQASLMLSFLKAHSGVWGIAHIPINLELLSWLWSKGKLIFEKGESVTLSKLYQTIVDQVQKSYIQKTSKRPAALALDGLMESKKEIVENTVINCVNEFLEYLAYRAMETETLFISSSEIRIALEKTLVSHECINDEYRQEQLLKSATDKLGFLRAAGQCDASQLDQEHYFIHLSFQEFYAAKYIARILDQHPHSEEGEQIFQRILTEKYTPRYQLMLWMSAGLLYQAGKKNQPQQFSPLLRFWRAILSQPRDMIGFHHMILVMHCLDECEADDRLVLHQALIMQQCTWFEIYAKEYKQGSMVWAWFEIYEKEYQYGNPYPRQLARCNILLTSAPMMKSLLKVLKNRDRYGDSLIYAAINLLGQLDNPVKEVIQVLVSLVLQDKEPRLWAKAAKILDKLNCSSEAIIPALLGALKGESSEVKQAAVSALGKLSKSSEIVIPALLNALQGENNDVKEAAVNSLGELSNLNEAVILALLDALKDKSSYVKRAVAKALGKLNNSNEVVVQALVCAFEDESMMVKEAIAKTLCKLNKSSKVVTKALLNNLQSQEMIVKQTAIKILGQLNDSREIVIKALESALQDKNRHVREAAVFALLRLNKHSHAAIQILLDAFQDEHHNQCRRIELALTLAQLKNSSEAVMQTLLKALKDKNPGISIFVAQMLGRLNNSSKILIEALIDILKKHDEVAVREAVAVSLGQLLSNLDNLEEAVIQALLDTFEYDRNPKVRWAVAKILDQHNLSKSVIEAQLRALQSDNEDIRRCAVEELGRLYSLNERVIDVLLNILRNDKHCNVRQAAIQALFTLRSLQSARVVFEQLVINDHLNFKYFFFWFTKNYLVCVDPGQGKVIACPPGHQSYYISLSPEALLHLEKQIITVAQQNYPLKLYSLSGYNTTHEEKSVLQACKSGIPICVVSDAMWLVHLVNKKVGERAFLVIEGIASEKHLVLRYELSLTQPHQNSSSHFFLPSDRVGRVVKTEDFLGELENDKKSYQCKSWDIDPVLGQRLLELLEADIGEPIPYGMLDGNFSGAVSASFSRTSRHDCLTWAEAKLKAIGLPVEGRWTDFVIVLPAVVTEQGGIAADSACEADPEPVMAEERDGKTEIPFVTAPVHHAEGMAEKMRQRGLFVTAVPKQQIAQSEVGLAELEKSREELLKGTAYKKFPSVRNLEELNNLIERLEKAKAEFEELGDDFPAERAAHLKRCQKAAKELSKIDEKIKDFQKNLQYTRSGLQAKLS